MPARVIDRSVDDSITAAVLSAELISRALFDHRFQTTKIAGRHPNRVETVLELTWVQIDVVTNTGSAGAEQKRRSTAAGNQFNLIFGEPIVKDIDDDLAQLGNDRWRQLGNRNHWCRSIARVADKNCVGDCRFAAFDIDDGRADFVASWHIGNEGTAAEVIECHRLAIDRQRGGCDLDIAVGDRFDQDFLSRRGRETGRGHNRDFRPGWVK